MIEIFEFNKKQTPSTGNLLHKDGNFTKELWMPLTEIEWEEVEDLGQLNPTKIIIEQSFEDNFHMLLDYPDFATYRKINDIPTTIENGKVVSYVSYLLPEHRVLLLQYNAIIK